MFSHGLSANCYAEMEQWDKAEADFIKADELGDNQLSCIATVRLASNNRAGYGQMCVLLLEKATPTAPETWIADAVENSIYAPAPGSIPRSL